MRGIVFDGERRCRVVERPTAAPGWGEVRVRVEASGICGSDLTVYRSPTATEQIRGHEPSGTVAAVGEGVAHLRVGDRVSVHHHVGCGHCPFCAAGETVACPEDRVVGVAMPGSFAESLVVPERNCIPLPDGVGAVDGAFMACVGGTAWGALRRLEARLAERLAVFGLGPVGLSCVILGRALGLRVAAVDLAPHRRELALACGAEVAVDPREDAPAALRDWAARPYAAQTGVDVLIETSGAAAARRAMLPSIRRGGRIAIVGVGSNEEVICPTAIHSKAATILGSVVFPLGWSWELARFLADTGTRFGPAVTHEFGLDQAAEALHAADAAVGGKVIFRA